MKTKNASSPISDELKRRLADARRVGFFTGAGVSAESGIPTFRGDEGLWKRMKPEELANFDAFMRNPDMVWEWYQYRRKIVNDAGPNAAHRAVVEMEEFYEVEVATQNVDNLHRRAGSTTVRELHGNIERNYCVECAARHDDVEIGEKDAGAARCECGGLIRPDVVWFGEMLPQSEFTRAEDFAASADLYFVVGTSMVVYPAAYIPQTARVAGAYLVEVNLEPTEFSGVAAESYFGKAGEILPRVVEAAREARGV
jgi:NAD-dependent deacetylase